MREGCWLGMVTQGGQGLGGLLESEVQCDLQFLRWHS